MQQPVEWGVSTGEHLVVERIAACGQQHHRRPPERQRRAHQRAQVARVLHAVQHQHPRALLPPPPVASCGMRAVQHTKRRLTATWHGEREGGRERENACIKAEPVYHLHG
jgi:hypothetical protein